MTAKSGNYAVIDAAGAVITYGHAAYSGDMLTSTLDAPIVGAAVERRGGYWLVAADGGIFSFGDARFYGSMGGTVLNKPIVGMAATADGGGYWSVAADGGIFSFGDARFYGSMGGTVLNKPIVGMATTADGGGYWLVAADGGIFAFGDARFYGSMGGTVLNKPIVGMAATADGGGYWLVAADGGIFAFGDAGYLGSLGGNPPGSPIVGITATPAGGGYWMAARDDSVYAFGDATYSGGTSSPLHPPLFPADLSLDRPARGGRSGPAPRRTDCSLGGIRVGFIGDSLAGYEALFTEAAAPGYLIDNGSMPSCGVTNGAEMQKWSTPGVYESNWPACADWAMQMQWVTDRFHPDAMVIQLGYWEEQNRLWNGSYANLGDPAYSAWIGQNLRRAVAIVHAQGAYVILNTSPYFGDGTPTWAVNDFNRMIQTVADKNPSFVSVLDVGHLLSPSGSFTQYLDGLQMRTSDNVHLTVAAVQTVIDPALNRLVFTLGNDVYRGRP